MSKNQAEPLPQRALRRIRKLKREQEAVLDENQRLAIKLGRAEDGLRRIAAKRQGMNEPGRPSNWHLGIQLIELAERALKRVREPILGLPDPDET